MSFDTTALKVEIAAVLKKYLTDTQAAWKDEYRPYLDAIAQDSLNYGAALLAGEPGAERNLEHVKVQAMTLGAIVYGAEAKRAIETLETVALTAAKIIGAALKAML